VPADKNAAPELIPEKTADNPADETKIRPDNDTENTDNKPQPETTPDKNKSRLSLCRLLIILGVTLIVSVSLVTVFLVVRHSTKIDEIRRNDIKNMIMKMEEYVEGGELFIDTLESYRDSLKDIDTKILKTDTVNYNYVLPRIDSAINIRKLIDTAGIAQWKESDLQCCHNSSLAKLKNAVDSLKKENYRDTIEMQLREMGISGLGLDSIASFVNNVLIKEDEKKRKGTNNVSPAGNKNVTKSSTPVSPQR